MAGDPVTLSEVTPINLAGNQTLTQSEAGVFAVSGIRLTIVVSARSAGAGSFFGIPLSGGIAMKLGAQLLRTIYSTADVLELAESVDIKYVGPFARIEATFGDAEINAYTIEIPDNLAGLPGANFSIVGPTDPFSTSLHFSSSVA